MIKDVKWGLEEAVPQILKSLPNGTLFMKGKNDPKMPSYILIKTDRYDDGDCGGILAVSLIGTTIIIPTDQVVYPISANISDVHWIKVGNLVI